jgi:hypothetical protein
MALPPSLHLTSSLCPSCGRQSLLYISSSTIETCTNCGYERAALNVAAESAMINLEYKKAMYSTKPYSMSYDSAQKLLDIKSDIDAQVIMKQFKNAYPELFNEKGNPLPCSPEPMKKVIVLNRFEMMDLEGMDDLL